VKYWEIIADNLKKAGWSWGACLKYGFTKADNFALWQQSVRTPDLRAETPNCADAETLSSQKITPTGEPFAAKTARPLFSIHE
jgi:hypothetical protein